MLKSIKILSSAAVILLASSCTDDVPMVSLGIDDSYRIERMRKL